MAEWKAIIHTGIMAETGDTHFARLKLDLLSKRHPKDYSEKRVVEHQGGMALRHTRMTDEELDAEIERLAGREGLMAWRRLIIEVYLALVILWGIFGYFTTDPDHPDRWFIMVATFALLFGPFFSVAAVGFFRGVWSELGKMGKVGE